MARRLVYAGSVVAAAGLVLSLLLVFLFGGHFSHEQAFSKCAAIRPGDPVESFVEVTMVRDKQTNAHICVYRMPDGSMIKRRLP